MSACILIVDDDELVRTGLGSNFVFEGFAVHLAASVPEAIEILAREPLDAVLCDLVLEEAGGLDLLTQVRERWPQVAFVMITAHGSVEAAMEAVKRGAADFIEKPMTPDDVVARVRAVLDAGYLKRTLLTDRQKQERQREEAEAQTLQSARLHSVSSLADGAAAHLEDLLSPLHGHAEILRRNGSLAAVAETLESVRRHAAELVRDLRLLGRSECAAGEPVALARLVGEYLQSADFEAVRSRHPGVDVSWRSAEMATEVLGPVPDLLRLLDILVTHACEGAGTSGRVEISLQPAPRERAASAAGRRPRDRLVLRVRHTGPGLEEEHRARLFEPYYAARVLGRRHAVGLGLAVARRLVEDLRGIIEVAGDRDGPAEVRVILPAAAAGPSPEAQVQEGHENVLVVDDHPEHRRRAVQALQEFGYCVLAAGSAQEAVRLYEAAHHSPAGQRIDLVVLDLVLGEDMDGVEVFQKMAGLHPGQKAILVSGFADTERIAAASNLGIRPCLLKPLNPEELGRAVRAALDGR